MKRRRRRRKKPLHESERSFLELSRTCTCSAALAPDRLEIHEPVANYKRASERAPPPPSRYNFSDWPLGWPTARKPQTGH